MKVILSFVSRRRDDSVRTNDQSEIVGQIAVDEEEVFHVLLADDEQAAGLVRARVGAAREVVDERHLAEVRAGAQDRQRLLAHPRHLAADAHGAREDEVHLVPLRPLLEDDGARRVVLLDAEVGDPAQVARLQRGEEADLREQLDGLLGRDGRTRGRPGTGSGARTAALTPDASVSSKSGSDSPPGATGSLLIARDYARETSQRARGARDENAPKNAAVDFRGTDEARSARLIAGAPMTRARTWSSSSLLLRCCGVAARRRACVQQDDKKDEPAPAPAPPPPPPPEPARVPLTVDIKAPVAIVTATGNKCLQFGGGSKNDLARAEIGTCNGSPAQQFKLQLVPGGYYALVSANSDNASTSPRLRWATGRWCSSSAATAA